MQEFLNQVCRNCFQSLHPLSNFQRRNLALALLDIITQQLNPAHLPSTISTVYSYKSLLSDNCVRDLVYVLYDTFDDNRILAIKVLDKIIGDTKSPEVTTYSVHVKVHVHVLINLYMNSRGYKRIKKETS